MKIVFLLEAKRKLVVKSRLKCVHQQDQLSIIIIVVVDENEKKPIKLFKTHLIKSNKIEQESNWSQF